MDQSTNQNRTWAHVSKVHLQNQITWTILSITHRAGLFHSTFFVNILPKQPLYSEGKTIPNCTIIGYIMLYKMFNIKLQDYFSVISSIALCSKRSIYTKATPGSKHSPQITSALFVSCKQWQNTLLTILASSNQSTRILFGYAWIYTPKTSISK